MFLLFACTYVTCQKFQYSLVVCIRTFSCRLYTGYHKIAVLALAPPTLETSGIFNDGILRYLHIYGFATEIATYGALQMCFD